MTKSATSTKRATFARERQVCSAVVRPAMTYESTAWHSPSEIKGPRKCTVDEMLSYRTNAWNQWQRPTRLHQPNSARGNPDASNAGIPRSIAGQGCVLFPDQLSSPVHIKQCKQVAKKLRKRRATTAPKTPGIQKARWALPTIEETVYTSAPDRPPLWMEEDENYLKQLEDFRTLQRQREKLIHKLFADKWQSSWVPYEKKHNRNSTVVQTVQLNKKKRD